MSAELLREAAALMRERAATATPGPWWVHSDDASMVWYGDEDLTMRLDRRPDDFTEDEWEAWAETTGQLSHGSMQRDEDAAYVATWHPTVALAVADWLDLEARCWEASSWYPDTPESLNVAIAYLGRDA